MSQSNPSIRPETVAVHSGYAVDPTTNSLVPPIYQNIAYAFDNAQHGADLFDLKVPGNIYSRIMNPTCDVLEKRMAELDGGLAALTTASGMSAIAYSIWALSEQGNNIVSTSQLYGGTYNLFAHTFPQQGLTTRFVDAENVEGFANAIDDKTTAVFVESIGNPANNVADLRRISEIAHAKGVPVIVDNTVPTPYLWRVLDDGADIAVYSLTKYLGGHGNSLGGVIVDSGRFDWVANKARFPKLNEPDPSYHGVVYTEALGEAAFIGRARVVQLRNTGAALSPFNAFLTLQGLATLGLRMEKHCENAQAVAEFLEGHAAVRWVNYAGLTTSAQHAKLQQYTKGRASGILSFGVKGGRTAGEKFLDALGLFHRAVNIGDVRSLATHPASTTHRQLSEAELATAGVSEDLVRLSIGIEHIEDIKADLAQALTVSQS